MPPPFFGVPFRSGGDVVENQEYNRPTEFLKGFASFGHAYKRVGGGGRSRNNLFLASSDADASVGNNAPGTDFFSRRLSSDADASVAEQPTA